ncbi:MAG: hypothetical protein HDR37_05165 [Treponema sp.]|nr:hypothetical protein [Treponema sp.]
MDIYKEAKGQNGRNRKVVKLIVGLVSELLYGLIPGIAAGVAAFLSFSFILPWVDDGLSNKLISIVSFIFAIIPVVVSLLPTIIYARREIGKIKSGTQYVSRARMSFVEFALNIFGIIVHIIAVMAYFFMLFVIGFIAGLVIRSLASSFLPNILNSTLELLLILLGPIIAMVYGIRHTRCPKCGKFFALRSAQTLLSKDFSHHRIKDGVLKEVYDTKYEHERYCIFCNYSVKSTSTGYEDGN